MTSKERCEALMEYIVEENQGYFDKERIGNDLTAILEDLEKLEEIRNTFKVEKEETINQNRYWLIAKKKPYYSYMITKEQYNNWKGWLNE